MKNTNLIKILKIILLLFIISLVYSNKVSASEASVTANNCNVGENFTVIVNIPQDVSAYDIGGIIVTYSDGSTETSKRVVKAEMDLSWPGNYAVSFPGKVAGNATISVNGLILSDSNHQKVNQNSNLQTTTTITEPAPVSTAPEQPAPVVVNFSNTNEKMYTNRRVNVRQNCGTENGIIQTLAVGTEVTRTGVGDKNKNGYSWSRISYNGITGYVITAALTYDEPVVDEEQPDESEQEQPPEETETLSDDNQEKISKIAEELGVIPEVGINIMPFLFIGCSVSCLYIMFEVKRKITK